MNNCLASTNTILSFMKINAPLHCILTRFPRAHHMRKLFTQYVGKIRGLLIHKEGGNYKEFIRKLKEIKGNNEDGGKFEKGETPLI